LRAIIVRKAGSSSTRSTVRPGVNLVVVEAVPLIFSLTAFLHTALRFATDEYATRNVNTA